MLLIWLMHFDYRWCWRKSLPFFDYFWILTATIKFLQLIQSENQYRNILLIIQAVLAIKIYLAIMRKKNEKNIEQYKKRVDVTTEMTYWVQKKVLKTMSGQIALLFSLLDIFWIFQDLFAFITIVPVVITLVGFIVIKLSALVLSWAYPELYIKINRKLN
ncbi:unnamed protein product [Paramecium pentaurelia]|uniref:Uncharacterized protein n=1 Tax=Paramecium pentaurelia TaxID=43138 RepID=A0A8S1XCQ2_9CILI|nr:unnamed protein product [Paramecium pentaurelia]